LSLMPSSLSRALFANCDTPLPREPERCQGRAPRSVAFYRRPLTPRTDRHHGLPDEAELRPYQESFGSPRPRLAPQNPTGNLTNSTNHVFDLQTYLFTVSVCL